MKIEPQHFRPGIYSAEFADGWHHLLACGRRIFKVGATKGKAQGAVMTTKASTWEKIGTWEHVTFPCVIEIPLEGVGISDKRRAQVQCADGHGRNWTINEPETFGISPHAAACALAEAWLGITELGTTPDTLLPRVAWKTKPFKKCDSLAVWSLNAWIRWDSWNKRGLNRRQRVEILNRLGFDSVKVKDLENAMKKRGMEMPLKTDPGF